MEPAGHVALDIATWPAPQPEHCAAVGPVASVRFASAFAPLRPAGPCGPGPRRHRALLGPARPARLAGAGPAQAAVDADAALPARTRGREHPATVHRPAAETQRADDQSLDRTALSRPRRSRPTHRIALAVNPARDRKLQVKVPKTAVRDWLEPDEVLVLLEAAERIDSSTARDRAQSCRGKAAARRREADDQADRREAEHERGWRVLALQTQAGRLHPASDHRDAGFKRRPEHRALHRASRRSRFRRRQDPRPEIENGEGVREIDMTPWLREQLLEHKASDRDARDDASAFPTRTGEFRDKDNLNRRVIGPVERATADLLAERGLPPLPTKLSSHVFRRTYISMMAEAGSADHLRSGPGRTRERAAHSGDLREGVPIAGSCQVGAGVRRAHGWGGALRRP
jgi:hypothetical protein